MIHVGDGTWNLRVYITDLQIQKTLRVKGDVHIGGVMLKLADRENPKDWSDHALWWPAKNIWLTRTRSTLDQVGLHADAVLHYTPMHKILRVQLPDFRYLDCRVNYSIKTFGAVVALCKNLGIRHPEELSLCKPLEGQDLKRNLVDQPKKKLLAVVEQNGHLKAEYLSPAADTNSFIPAHSNLSGSNGSLENAANGSPFLCAPVQNPYRSQQQTPISSPTGVIKFFSIFLNY
jgi:kindlin 2